MIIKNFKLFELNTFKNLKDDINGILVELKDMGYTVRTFGLYDDGSICGGDTFSFVITKDGGFLVNNIKSYLDTCIDYMNIYYKYKTEISYKLMNSNKSEDITYKQLRVIGNVAYRIDVLTLIFTDISKK